MLYSLPGDCYTTLLSGNLGKQKKRTLAWQFCITLPVFWPTDMCRHSFDLDFPCLFQLSAHKEH